LTGDLDGRVVWLEESSLAVGGETASSNAVAAVVVVEADWDVEFMRGDQGNISAGSTPSGGSWVLERHLKESTVFSIEQAGSCLKVGNG